MEATKIRPANNGDEEVVTNMVFQVLREHGLSPDLEKTDADLKDIEGSYIKCGGCFEVILDDKDVIVGSVGLYPISNHRCELRKMYLHRSVRGKGLGKLLLEHALLRATELGFKEVVLETATELKKATDLYRQYGFVPYEAPHLSARCDQAFIKSLPHKNTELPNS